MINPNSPPPPRQLSLSNQFRPQGYYTTFKQWPIFPNSSNQYWAPNDVIRFYNTVDSGVMDPYRSQLQFVVQVNQNIQPVGQLQVDKSASSFFSQLVMSSRNVEIQRISEYDTLAALLSDIGTSQVISQGRTFEGMGYGNNQTNQNWTPSQSSAGQLILSNADIVGPPPYSLNNITQNTINPTRVGSWTGIGNSSNISLPNVQGLWQTSVQASGLTPSNCGLNNYLCYGSGDSNTLGQLATNGRFMNIRAQYNCGIQNNTYPDTTTSTLQLNPIVANQIWTPETMTGNSTNSGYGSNRPYQLLFPQSQTANIDFGSSGMDESVTYPLTAGLHGYARPMSSQTSKSGFQATLSATVPTCQMNQGMITNGKFAVNQRKFCVPIFSAIVGALIPPDQFLLIQMKALKDLLLQFTLSPFAMFTSGYSDVHQFDAVGMGVMQKRSYMITSIQWNIHLYTFQDSQINMAMQASLTKGIAITTNFYFVGNTFQLPNGQVVRNMWPISCQSQSLSQIYCVFLSNEYQKYTFCRKQFRLSNNITSMQVRLKTEFFPSQPIIGNAGNPQYFQNQMDNSNFLKQLYWSNNYVFNMNVPMPKINKVNFAINGRCYNPSNTQTYYPAAILNNSTYEWTANSVNTDTALGMSSFHQNRYIGMAIFSWTWDPYGHSSEYMTGINTNGNQNFAIQFTTSPQNPFPSDQTLIIFCRSNGIVLYTDQGIKVMGK